MRRRDVLLAFGAAAVAARGAGATPPPLIVALSPDPTEFTPEYLLTPFNDVMREHGWETGRDFILMTRSTGGSDEGLPAAARDLVSREPRVFLAFGDAALAAARQATTTIPIVGLTDDMVGGGHVASMAHPEGNTTGVSIQAGELDAKRLELLHQLVPAAHRVGALADPTTPWTRHTVETAARQLGLDLDFAVVQTAAEAFTEIRRMAAGGVGALNLCSSASLYAARAQIAELVAQLRLPTMYLAPEAAEEGGLAGYGPPFAACYRQQVELAVKILKGAKPADLPVQQPVKFNLVINMKTARALGLTVPQSLLALADEVIE